MREVLNGFPKFLEVSLPENNVSSVFQLPKLTKNPPAYRRVYKISVYKKIPIRPQAVSSILKMRCVLSAPLSKLLCRVSGGIVPGDLRLFSGAGPRQGSLISG